MAAELPPEQRASYAAIIDEILENADLQKISAKAIRQGMQARVDYDLTPQKSAITALIMERFDKAQAAEDATSQVTKEPAPTTNGTTNGHTTGQVAKKRKAESDESEMSEVEDIPSVKKAKKSTKPETESDEAFAAKLQAQLNAQARPTRGGVVKKRSPVKKEKKKQKQKSATKVGAEDDSEIDGVSDSDKVRKGGFHKLMGLSEPLSALLGETALSRPQTVKRIWAYVKERDLQNPDDKRQIRCDDKLRAVFKTDQVHMFTMNKILAGHLYPMEE